MKKKMFIPSIHSPSNRIRMHRNPLNPHPLPFPNKPPLPIHLPLLQPPQRLHPLLPNHPPKHRILPIQMRRGPIRDEELAPVRVGPFVRHGHDPARVVAQRGADLVFEVGAPDRGAGFRGGAGGGAGLDHEGGEGAVDGGVGVGVGGAEG